MPGLTIRRTSLRSGPRPTALGPMSARSRPPVRRTAGFLAPLLVLLLGLLRSEPAAALNCSEIIPLLPASTTTISTSDCDEGTLPPEISRLVNLTHIIFYGRSLSGTLPSVLAKLLHLEQISFNREKISGTLPEELTRLPKLTDLVSTPDITALPVLYISVFFAAAALCVCVERGGRGGKKQG